MLKIETVATTWFTCDLSDEDEKKIVGYIKDHPDEFEFMDKDLAKEAVMLPILSGAFLLLTVTTVNKGSNSLPLKSYAIFLLFL